MILQWLGKWGASDSQKFPGSQLNSAGKQLSRAALPAEVLWADIDPCTLDPVSSHLPWASVYPTPAIPRSGMALTVGPLLVDTGTSGCPARHQAAVEMLGFQPRVIVLSLPSPFTWSCFMSDGAMKQVFIPRREVAVKPSSLGFSKTIHML